MIRKEIQLLIDRLNQNHPKPNIEHTSPEHKEDSQNQALFSAIEQHGSRNYWAPKVGNFPTRP
ncbi:MAG: hypothetical protein U1E78_11475 [Gammaproteobacteria bacterium]